MRRSGRNHSRVLEARVALAALPADNTRAELVQHFDVRLNQITQWNGQLQERVTTLLDGQATSSRSCCHDQGAAREDWSACDGECFFRKRARQGGIVERKRMIDREHELSMVCQCEVLGLSLSRLLAAAAATRFDADAPDG